MNIGKIKIYCLEIILTAILVFTLFAPNIIDRIVLAIILLIFTIILNHFLKKRNPVSMFEKPVNSLLIIFGIIFIGVYYLLGLYFGFVRPKVSLSLWSLYRFIIPISVIVISSEYIRKILLSQDAKINFLGKKINLSLIFTYIISVLIDLLIYTGLYNLSTLNDVLTIFGYVLFASLSCNLLYNYISKRYGNKGIIYFRLITILYVYILPIVPDVYIFLSSFLRMLYPYLIYIILERTYARKTPANVNLQEKNKSIIGNTILIVLMTLGIMLISCKFTYGILVIGSYSMTGTINKGDAIVYEEYKNQKIDEGQIIVFDLNGLTTIHRVVKIENVNGNLRYYTKGDYNKKNDNLYRTSSDIKGLVKLKIKYIGLPTLWLRSLFE